MSKINPKEHISKFLKQRENYLQNNITESRFYSIKHKILISVAFSNESDYGNNVTYIKISTFQEALNIILEFEPLGFKNDYEQEICDKLKSLYNKSEKNKYLILRNEFVDVRY